MNQQFNKRRKFYLFPLFGLLKIFVGAWIVQLLWNAILPGLVNGVNTLTYWKALGLLVLCRILFGSFRSRYSGRKNFNALPSWKEKMMQMTPEEKERFQTEWRERCGKK